VLDCDRQKVYSDSREELEDVNLADNKIDKTIHPINKNVLGCNILLPTFGAYFTPFLTCNSFLFSGNKNKFTGTILQLFATIGNFGSEQRVPVPMISGSNFCAKSVQEMSKK
jgi:hypothetical protein